MFESMLQARRRASMDVHFFEIAFQARVEGGYSLVATDSRGRQATEPWVMPIDEQLLSAIERDPSPWRLEREDRSTTGVTAAGSLRDLSTPAGESAAEDEMPQLEELGRALFVSLFDGEVRRLYSEDVGYRDRDESLCIVLTFDPTDRWQMRLLALPWECLHGGREFLGLSGRPIVRRLQSSVGQPVEPLQTRKLRILAVTLDENGLDLEAEKRSLQAVHQQSGAFDLEFAPRGYSLLDVRRRLENGAFHVVHMMGHGSWSAAEAAWGVELGGSFVSATELARQLRGELSRVRLVVLNTCHSARTLDPETARATRGLAAGLIEAGALAVLANGAPITDVAARASARGFYDRVATGWSLPHALAALQLDVHGEAEENRRMRRGEWTTPRLHLRTRGRLLVVRPRRWSPRTVTTLLAGGLGLLALLATAGVWLSYPEELRNISLALASVSWALAWGWIRYFFADTHPLSGLADALARRPGPAALVSGFLLLLGALAWLLLGVGRLEKLPCVRKAPDIDWSRSVLVDLSSPGGVEAWRPLWLNDLKVRLKTLHWISRGSELGGAVRRSCFASVIEGRVEPVEGGSVTHLRVERGRRGDQWSMPGSPAEHEEVLAEQILAVLRGDAVRIGDELSEQIKKANAAALAHYRQGDFGRAKEVLEDAVHRDPDAALLRGNLAQIFFDMSRQARRRRVSLEHASSEREEKRLLAKALRHLDVAVDEEPDQALHFFHRGRVHHRLVDVFGGDTRDAERDFRAALERRPLFPEAANDLAYLLLDRDGSLAAKEAQRLLEQALAIVDSANRSTRAALLKNLGWARRLADDLDGAWQALDQAECLAPASRLDVKAEALGRSAELFTVLLGPASAEIAWWRYGGLLQFDHDETRRRSYFEWRLRNPHRADDENFRLWARRCELGELGALTGMNG